MTCRLSPPQTPVVSVIVPVRNEVAFIDGLVRSVLAQDVPPDGLEVIVADGRSDDGTREVLAALEREDNRVIVIDNPGRIVSTGLNLAIARARGDIIVRVDGHALIEGDFLRQNVLLLSEHPEAWSVGGPIRHVARTTFGRAVAVAMSHPLGVGNARHRYPDYEGYAEGAQFPAIRRWVFDRVGLFDERLVRNQDDEFNYRMTSAGGRVFISPRIRYAYFVRPRARQLFKQYFQYGFWRIPVMEKHRRPTTWRQLAPSLFIAACAAAGMAGAVLREALVAMLLPATYGIALLLAAARCAPRHGIAVAARLPLAIATMHAGYGLGMAYGLWARLFRAGAWDAQGAMAEPSR